MIIYDIDSNVISLNVENVLINNTTLSDFLKRPQYSIRRGEDPCNDRRRQIWHCL